MEILTVENLSFVYPQCENEALSNISFSAECGEFITVCGGTGSGKTTLLRLLKPELSPLGEKRGTVNFEGVPTGELTAIKSAGAIGYVMQRPEQQIVTDTVWHELAFGLENLGEPQKIIERRVAETASYFGISHWFDKRTDELSGGQKQILNLASVMIMNPKLLILDEPTAQLDPIAASEFITVLKKLNSELGVTVIISEHRLEEIIPISDKLLIMDKGMLIHCDSPDEVVKRLSKNKALLKAMPAAVRLYHEVNGEGACPISIREGRSFIESSFENDVRCLPENGKSDAMHKPALRFKEIFFRYERNQPDVLSGMDFTVYENEIFCLLGGNGSGKTTMLSVAADILKPYSGTVEVFGKKIKSYKNQTLYRECLALLPQDVQTVFLRNTVGEELEEAGAEAEMLPYDISSLSDKHPYDLSGGEQQLTALAKVLAAKPKLLLLDEPTKGIDAQAKHRLTEIIKQLRSDGMTIVAVTHDVEFAAECADRCAMCFNGRIAAEGAAREFFYGNNFYTTPISRMTRGYFDKAVTVSEAAQLCLANKRRKGAH